MSENKNRRKKNDIKSIMKRNKYTITLIMSFAMIVGGLIYDDNWKKVTSKTIESATVFANKKIDNHEYQEIPWDVFMTDKDRELLYANNIPVIPSLDLTEQNIQEKISYFDEILSDSETYLTDRELFRESIDEKDKFVSPINAIYGGSSAGDFYYEILSNVYTKRYTYPDSINMISIGLKLGDNETFTWDIKAELNVLQDKETFLTYPLSLTFDEQGHFISGKAHKVVESQAGTRPITIDPLIEENTHMGFLANYQNFSTQFNINEETGKTDSTHLISLVSDTLSIETLEKIFEASNGDITNGSFVSWVMNDNGADAMSYYWLDIPYDVEGNVLRVKFTYSRAYDEIQGIEVI